MMKAILFASAAALLVFHGGTAAADQAEFCRGFDQGYVTGYKRASGSGFDPFTPFCPFQPFKRFSDPDSDFEHGYIIGFEKGVLEGSR